MFIVKGIPGYSSDISDIYSMIFSLFTLMLFSSILEISFFNTFARRIVIPFVLSALWGLNAYQLSSGSSLDYSLVRDNIGISFSAEAFTMISSPFSTADIIFLILLLASVIFVDRKFSLKNFSGGVNLKSWISSLVLWSILVSLPVQCGDGFTLFAKSILSSGSTELYAQPVSSDYPYEKNSIPLTSFSTSVPSAKKSKPNVFVILIESFNANFVEAVAPDGIEYTPNFNALAGRGLYIDRFYGNSIQTCKGQAAVFFSILPSFNGKIFVDYPDLNVSGFPAILNDAGYRTIFFQAFHNLAFDNTKNSMLKAGFSVVKSYAEYRRKEDRPYIWGWGVEDKIFYERFFEMLDSIHAKAPEKPVFAALTTVGTHIPCDGMPPEKRTIFKDPQNIKEKYSNALRLSDSQLPRFFELLRERNYLENSIVIITADHSFPMKEHGIYNNEVCFYDETFRIPFLVIWDGVIKPERIKGRAYSQIDIGPSITDMLGIKEAKHNMTGISVFDRKSSHPVYLIQPYNGRFLQVVKYPLKYITHQKTGKEYLFDLEKDPGERANLMLQNYDAVTISGLKESLNAVYLNQQLIEGNRIRRNQQ
jgi:phosphoglycerol transferase MdoB-like AlkP superfamily enzyme